jgi:multiple sugar transport system permease protein
MFAQVRPVPMIKRAVVVYLPVAALLLITLFPFYWMAITAFKPNDEFYNTAISPFVVLHPTLDHFVYLFTKTHFPDWLRNTMVVAIVATLLSLVASVMAGYSLGRLRYPGANWLGWAIFVTYLVPPTLLFLPLTAVIANFNILGWEPHLLNSIWSLILTYPTFLVPFGTWLLIGYFKSIPHELEESALVDGATRLQAMLRITIPLALPGLLSVGIFSFTLSWNEFIYALVFLSDVTTKTVPVGVISELIAGDQYFWAELMAGALLGSVPVAIVYSFFVEYFVSGLTAGAVKG